MAKAVTQRVFEQIQTHKHILIHLLSQTPFIYQSTVLEAKKHGAPINIMRFVSTTDLAIGCIFTFRIHETCPTRTSCLPNLLPLLRLLSLIDTAPSSFIQHICYADEHNSRSRRPMKMRRGRSNPNKPRSRKRQASGITRLSIPNKQLELKPTTSNSAFGFQHNSTVSPVTTTHEGEIATLPTTGLGYFDRGSGQEAPQKLQGQMEKDQLNGIKERS